MSILLIAIAKDALELDDIRSRICVIPATPSTQEMLTTVQTTVTVITSPMKVESMVDAAIVKEILAGNLPTGVTLAPKLRGCVQMYKVG